MADYPQKLQDSIEDFSFVTNRMERQDFLIQLADQFDKVKVTDTVATQPYDEFNHVKECESDAYVWWTDNDDGTLNYHFDVLNPQGLSAMAMAVILGDSCSGAPLEQVAAIDENVVFEFFGKNVSMGKGQGLMGIVRMVKTAAHNKMA